MILGQQAFNQHLHPFRIYRATHVLYSLFNLKNNSALQIK